MNTKEYVHRLFDALNDLLSKRSILLNCASENYLISEDIEKPLRFRSIF